MKINPEESGVWKPVTNPYEVKEGQRVRYDGDAVGFSREYRFAHFEDGDCQALDSGGKLRESKLFRWGDVHAFFPLKDNVAKTPKKVIQKSKGKPKVAKVRINGNSQFNWFVIRFANCEVLGDGVKTRQSAIRGAKRFCETIGYECEIVK